ncbi:hypothetical protein GGR21_002730 [Dysgonomonas hofstadii]|uniref:Uncharacterized protein n=1 Tax=Dysgonomonas hofstadii TaxID=637886 RepID=A0A840CL77_9BACT|nr:hypothetical protein [Dysgonomonas hofstadii]
MFLFPKAAKGTKNALVAHPSCDPLQAQELNGKIVLRTLSISRPSRLTGAPHYGSMPPGKATSRQSNPCRRIATPASVPQAGHPIRQWRRRTKSCPSSSIRFVFSFADERVLFVQPQRRFWVAGGMKP